ncbi:hypothetical protein BN946_scf184942.g83 [Trametes cinnabarina]|uniref:Chromo domain-containing protein n=1 Tax=Pycnoporus cinnabarinus TaxID=5643 RepID=A0A060SD49_PYCCI|nr:hypothetical protein BN946_scf184942.g83 [Trametes cinnabarina]
MPQEYRVKWANYDSEDDTWEPEEHLDNCKRLLASFWADVGMDDNDYEEGYIVKATPSWIKREKKIFARTLGGSSGRHSSLDDSSEPEPSTFKGKEKEVPKEKTTKKLGRPPKVLTSTKAKTVAKSRADHLDEPRLPRKGKKRAKDAKAPSKQEGREDESGSESAGSLFSGRDSSPEVALGTLASGHAAGAQSSTIPAKRPSVDEAGPSHRRKRQVMEMPMPITGAVGNPTKARLAQRGQQPAPPPPAQALGIPQSQKQSLSNFSFKKKSATAAAPPPPSVQTDSPTIPALPRRTSETVQSPVTMDAGTPQAQSPGEAKRTSIPLPRRNTIRPQPKDPLADANKFLSDIMPPEMAAPLREESMSGTPATPDLPTGSSKPKPQLPRITKKWRWSGDLFMDISRERSERVCAITLHDPTEPLPNGLRFSILLKDDNLHLSAFHDLTRLPLFLDACQRPQQFAQVGHLTAEDSDAVKQLAFYMMKRAYFSFAHLYLDDTSAALLVIFPAGHPTAIKYLKVPPGSTGESVLQAALVPWELTAKEFCQSHWRSRETARESALDRAFEPAFDGDGRKVVNQRRFHQALHILGFPKTLHEFMSAPNHPYCIWHAPGDTTNSCVGYETLLLKEVLSTYPSPDNGHKADVRVIFTHVGSLEKLYCLPAIAERRMKRPELRFVTYGTHPSVPRERWGMRDIFPLGGVVTFTPSAIMQGHIRLFRRIKQIAEHPTWDCYVLPSVVAMVAKLSCQGLNPLQVYDEGNFVYEELLTSIEDGSVSLLQAPQVSRDPPAQDDPALLWTRWMVRASTLDARGILEECLRIAAEQFANTADADLPLAIEKEIARDMMRMQVQPAIMDNYRRFVVFRTKQDSFFAEESKYGVECTSCDRFDFRDGYFATNDKSNDSEKK